MTPNEIGALIELNRPKEVNGMNEDDYYNMLERREKLAAQGLKVI